MLHRTGQLQDHAAAAVATLHLTDARVSVPHSRPEGAAAAARPAALQRDHRSPAHQGVPVRRQRHHQRVCCLPFRELLLLQPSLTHSLFLCKALGMRQQLFTTFARKWCESTALARAPNPVGTVQSRCGLHCISAVHTHTQ